MRRSIAIALILSVMLLLVPVAQVVAQDGEPTLPHQFYGTVKIRSTETGTNVDAPAGTIVSAKVDGVEKGRIMVTTPGKYGGPTLGEGKLLVSDVAGQGNPIEFYINETCLADVPPGGWPGFDSEAIDELNLTAYCVAPAPAAPTGGAGIGPDTTPPIISGVLLCPEGVTETTADICWITDESSTSQVEYWASPSMLSPLDETMVTVHQVQLTGLAPCTTYNYRTMSRDAADNLAVSDEYTFTTLGEVPATAFTSSDLSISPGEVQIGETVTISAQVTNTGNCPGSYTVTLKINGAVEATEDIIVNAGASEEVTFTTAKDVAGSYSVDVNGLSGSFIVKEKVAPPPPPPPEAPPEVKPPINWFLIGGIIAGVVIVGLLIFLLVRRRAY